MTHRQPPARVAYVNARLIDPATGLDTAGALLTEGETIADFGPDLFKNGVPEGAEVVDCKGQVLCPGLVDARVHLREPGEAHKESVLSAGQAAVAGGVTTMVGLPGTDPVIDDEAAIEFVARRARQVGLTKVYAYAAATKQLRGEELAEMGLLANAGALAFTDGLRPITNAQVMRRALQYAATFGLMVVQQPYEPTLAQGVMNSGAMATRLGLSGIPREAELLMLERDLRLVEMTGGRYHASLISTAESVELIRRAKDKGLRVTCDTAPPYFALNELAIGEYRTFAKLFPPLRGEDDRRAIVEGLKDGVIDAVVSDHAPQDQDTKRLPFAEAAFGGIGLETLLPVTLEMVHNKHLSLVQALRLVTSAPADLLGLEAGRLKKGAPADLVLLDPEKPWKFEADRSLSKSKNSPFDGRLLQGRVLRTVVDARTVHLHGSKSHGANAR